jgi:hypothetical protein
VDESAVESFQKMLREDKVRLEMNSAGKPLKIGNFAKPWRIKIWDHGFFAFFCGQ